MNENNEIPKKNIKLEDYKELIELLPSIKKATLIGLSREYHNPGKYTKLFKKQDNVFKKAMEIFQGKWSLLIVDTLFNLGRPYYNDLKKALPEVNSRILSLRLSSFEKNGIVKRKVHAGKPIRVSYKLTRYAKEFILLSYPMILFLLLEEKKKLRRKNKT